ncbi:MAG TPA: glycosyltransferase family 2 protein [Devosia sp.]|jgi:cellulose synthase (UDP-forming)|uniref:glycosyltransferase family 2 protein n=1 Tax=Devosia sp. TaxID=1871048 RepID=UPI002DDD578D|nr:glycosyltransferase family 2 protein [Devosia sp.]HEV2516786.1 glycosyltransferase family 2 protein [Devosia sp.]
MEPVLSGRSRWLQTLGALVWTTCFVFLWAWWIHPEHIGGIFPFLTATATLLWVTLTPAYFLLIFRNSRRPSSAIEIPPELRIAMVVTKAPSEPLDLVIKTLTAMLEQDVPHDTWLADEAPTPEILNWAELHGVKVSTRFGVTDYHRSSWPRRTRCKEGNLAYFYDHYGYDLYDVVVQLDADHVPEQGYLRAMVQPFADPAVGYVSAPSICDSNANQSWSARGRLYAEASLHGSLQAGYNGGWAPLCIGSHYAVRTAALRQIGGLGPELAEDHSTTLMMNSGGWRGVHAIDAIAHGLGPASFADLAVQEFQWSRSLVTILLQHTGQHLGNLPFKLKFQFLFSQLWYPIFAIVMLLSVMMPILALAFDFTFVNVAYFDFLLHFLPMAGLLIVLAFAWRATGTFRPYNAKIVSWENAVFVFARWPWAILGTIAAIVDTLAHRRTEFRVTPKASSEAQDLPLSVLAPYACISIVSGLAAFAIHDIRAASGYYLFAALNAAVYALVLAIILIAHRRENRVERRDVPWLARTGTVAVLSILPLAAVGQHGLDILDAVAWNSNVRFTETKFSVAGAGMGQTARRSFSFSIKWPGAGDS